jgi:hypothetical protein
MCRDCGEPFPLSDDEVDFFARRNLHLPKRCRECRIERREQKDREQQRWPSSPVVKVGGGRREPKGVFIPIRSPAS